jgi:hypothetical protein
MIQDHIREMIAKGFTCDDKGKCVEVTKSEDQKSSIVDTVTYRAN